MIFFSFISQLQSWQICLGEDGKVAAVLQDTVLEIRTKRGNFSNVVARTGGINFLNYTFKIILHIQFKISIYFVWQYPEILILSGVKWHGVLIAHYLLYLTAMAMSAFTIY